MITRFANRVNNLSPIKKEIVHFILSTCAILAFSLVLYYIISFFPIPQMLPYIQIIQFENNFKWLRFLLSVLFSSGYCFVGSISAIFKYTFQGGQGGQDSHGGKGGKLEFPYGLSFLSVFVVTIVSSGIFLAFLINHGCDIPKVTFQVQGYPERFIAGSTVLVKLDKNIEVSAIAPGVSENELICVWDPEAGISISDPLSCTTFIKKLDEGVAYLSLHTRTQICDVSTPFLLYFEGTR